MGKGTKSNKGKAPENDASKKRKRGDKSTAEQPKQVESLSLFGNVQNSELDDIFAKSSTFAAPAAAIASSSKLVSQPEAAQPAAKKNKVIDAPESDGESDEESDEAENLEDESDDSEGLNVEAGEQPSQEEDADEDEQESEADSEDMVHESLKAKAEKKAKKAKSLGKYTPPGETAADKDRRTVFVGNLPLECAQQKSALHQLQRHLLTFVPSAKIESVRFRSVPFAAPTASLPTDDPEKDATQRVKREKERAAAWRAQNEGLDVPSKRSRGGDEEPEQGKIFLDSKGKRKVAFIKKDFHSELASCNAYVVFAHPHPDRSANVAPILDPFEAATTVLSANASTFMGRTIRVDSLRLPSAVALKSAGNALAKRDAWLPSGTDPKKSLFVGGLDYASKEEDIRVFFEELVKSERGGTEDKWVTGVRIVRDKETQLGKGFGYVHFTDRESVDEILALDSKKIKFAKRYLRVQPCKTLPSTNTLNNTIKTIASKATASSSSGKTDKDKDKKGSKVKSYVSAGPIPKGNPKLGEKIKDLSKEERKVFKSSDADRQARRMAKKKAKHALERNEKGAVKLNLTKNERERTKGAKPKAKKGKKRAPSAIAKMKGSRA
ncbi:uncharacterized protein I303_102878 [Kwoniella dejecticola CBS 10117]|uniref:Nucleolar protein 12 n=1 Tax=Kwoniella dejecticola CBS 10117 TaxID=1296121 RepID=A0A1A6A9Z6_9TREE|nr:nucleolar protein 12 [Kwoniella dejecticola CBS 10117]OBR86876.1 nucleolar protein 12 [Kwoniella dejecticola CBS 10117]